MFRRITAKALVALLLVPAMLLSSTGAAEAATAYGPKTSWGTEWTRLPGPDGIGQVRCNFTSYWKFDGFMQTVETSARCTEGSLIFGEEAWDVRLRFEGTAPAPGDTNGGTVACGMANDVLDEVKIVNGFSATAKQGYSLWGLELPAPPIVQACNVNRVCYAFVLDGWGDDKEHRGCQSVAVGGPNPTAPSPPNCTDGTVVKPQTGQAFQQVTGSGSFNTFSQWQRPVTVSVTSKAATNMRWQPYVITKVPGNTGQYSIYYGAPGTDGLPLVTPVEIDLGGPRESPTIVAPSVTQTWTMHATASRSGRVGFGGDSGPAPAPETGYQVIGYGIYRVYGQTFTISNDTWAEADVRQAFPPNWKPYKIGVSKPSECAYYWGQKITNIPADNTDEPLGPVDPPGYVDPGPGGSSTEPTPDNAPEPQPDTGCGFSVTDPSTWASAGICALVGLIGNVIDALMDILKAVKGLGAAIVNGITAALTGMVDLFETMLTAVFVPSEDPFESALGDARETWYQSNGGDWQDTILGGGGQQMSARVITPTDGGGGNPSGGPIAVGSGLPNVTTGLSVPSKGTNRFSAYVTTGAGCRGPVFNIARLTQDIPGGGIGSDEFDPLDSCSGKMADFAKVAHMLLTIIVAVGGGLKSLSFVTDSLGATKNIRAMADFDWSGAVQKR